jgi:23S rRNA (guanine2535-N1)-methyltransferase
VSYRLVTSRNDYRDLASGHVFHSLPGYPAFPVRLAQEMVLRAASHLPADRPLTVWDPCSGSGYLASVVGLPNRARIGTLVCSDIDPDAVSLAARNLDLLTELRGTP